MDILSKKFGINQWKTHHGRTSKGTDVRSLRSQLSDDGTALKIAREGDQVGYVAKTNEFEVFAIDLLQGLGYSVTNPQVAGA